MKCAPDVFVKLGAPDTIFRSWKTWERGAPDLAVEIDCTDDGKRDAWDERVARLWEAGVRELVQFAPEAPAGSRLHIWDRIEGDLVERVVEADAAPCVTLGLWWSIQDDLR
jgi:Uma2 family endonuclease